MEATIKVEKIDYGKVAKKGMQEQLSGVIKKIIARIDRNNSQKLEIITLSEMIEHAPAIKVILEAIEEDECRSILYLARQEELQKSRRKLLGVKCGTWLKASMRIFVNSQGEIICTIYDSEILVKIVKDELEKFVRSYRGDKINGKVTIQEMKLEEWSHLFFGL